MDFVVLSSSRGTTFQAITDRLHDGALKAKCLGLVSDRADRGCVEKGKKAGMPVAIVEKNVGESYEAYDIRLHQSILSLGATPKKTLIAAIGWMFVLTPSFIAKWKHRILNVHPALLPTYGGKGMYGMKVHKAVLSSGDPESGMTIHLMDEGIDTGPILLQKKCPVLPKDTPESLKARVQELEKEWYPKVLQAIHSGEMKLPNS